MEEISTIGMSREQWLKEREKGIGGSDGAAILGLNPYKTADEVYEDKKGLSEEQEDNDRMKAGRLFEDAIAQWYSEKEAEKVANVNRILVHPKYSFIRANVDRRIVGKKKVLECKNVDGFTFRRGDWGEEYTDNVPEYYFIQVHHYMLFPQFGEAGDLAACVGGNQLKTYNFEPDKEIAEMMVETYAHFWDNLEKGIRPDPQNLDDLKRRWSNTVDDAIEATDDIVKMAERLADIKATIKNAEAEKEKVLFILQGFMKEYSTLNIGGSKAHTWKFQNRTSLDSKKLKEERPEIFSEYQKTSTFRVFR